MSNIPISNLPDSKEEKKQIATVYYLVCNLHT